MVALTTPPPRPEETIPNLDEVEVAFRELLQQGASLNMPYVAAAQNALQEVLREHARLLTYMETHSRPNADAASATAYDDDGDTEPACVYTFRVMYDGAITAVQDSVVAAAQRAAGNFFRAKASLEASSSSSLTEDALQCIGVLIESLGWALHRSIAFTGDAQGYLTSMQQKLSALSTHAMSAFEPGRATLSSSSTSPATSNTAVAALAIVLPAWLRQANVALSTLSHFVSKTYPHGPWFAHHNRRAVERSRRLRHPSDVGEAPFETLVRAASRVQDRDVEALSKDVIRRREDDRPHAHAVLEAGNVFTWLATDLEPCVVIEEAFSSANTYIKKITARGNVLLLQQENGCALGQRELAKATVTWAVMLRDALERMVLLVLYRYPRAVPWGESLESRMPRYISEPRPPSVPRDRGEAVPVWRRSQTAAEQVVRPPTHPPSSTISSTAAPAPPMPRTQGAVVVGAMPPPSKASKFAEPQPTDAQQSKPTPECTFDAVTQTWTVQHYHQPLVSPASGAKQEPVLVVLPEEKLDSRHLVRILDCFNTYVTIPVKVRGVAVERCQNSKLQLASSVGPVRISDTERQEVLIETSAPGVHAAKVSGLTIHLAEECNTPIVTRMASNVNATVTVRMADGDQERRELALPEQYITTIKEVDQLVTREVTYSG
ncbi:Adenylate cyclase associated (CAP) C terminal family protein [Leishmania donovani]|uniref:Adenylate cyclase associated (CAP) C terminal family protein n=1 Tax=Leishmania donovani TaxID=5661 RepID=A0A504XND8_LEIDO|nr:Adenylate cyclase associated (CAP) C terminal family protein [Leishmania donovani]